MEPKILGLHHITAIAGDAQRNYSFYTGTLGLRLVKKTVNFDDPGTYHFYYGDERGTPGTILTFFPWQGIRPGRMGTGMATEIGYAVPLDALPFWAQRFKKSGISHLEESRRFDERFISFRDPDGLLLNMVAQESAGNKAAWTTNEITADVATRSFRNVVLLLKDIAPTAAVLTSLFGYRLLAKEGSRHRYITDAIDTANIVDLVAAPNEQRGINAGGTNHHVAFRVADENVLMAFRKKIVDAGFNITEKIDRNYFYSLYFREPGGVLFELATDNPGFAVDEPAAALGTSLKLPPQYEPQRAQIEKVLPVLK